jgi:hypothetical protein
LEPFAKGSKNASFASSASYRVLSFDLEAVFTAGADHVMASFGFWEPKHGLTVGAFTVYVCFPITEFIFSEAKEAAEFFVFPTAFLDVS